MTKYEAIIKNTRIFQETNGQYGMHSGIFSSLEEANDFIQSQIGMPNRAESEVEVEINDISEKMTQYETNIEALSFLSSSDWKILRHLRQQALGVSTSLTAEEYLALEHERQAAADSIVK